MTLLRWSAPGANWRCIDRYAPLPSLLRLRSPIRTHKRCLPRLRHQPPKSPGPSGRLPMLTVVQCDQTTATHTLRITRRDEVGQSFQGRVRFVWGVRLQHGNSLDCSAGALSARRRRLGIFSLARLTRLSHQHVHALFDPVCAISEGERSAPRPDRRRRYRLARSFTFSTPRTKSTLQRCVLQED